MTSQVTGPSTGKVLVLGTDSRVVLAIARSLGRKRIEVDLGWLDPQAIAHRSRYVSRSHVLPPYHAVDTTWKQELLKLVDREAYQLIIPCNDSTLVPLQLHRHDFAHVAGLHLHCPGVFEVVSNKIKSFDLAQNLGVSVSRTVQVTSAEDRAQALTLQLPVVVKPLTTFDGKSSPDHSNVVTCASQADELQAILLRPPYSLGCLVQEYFVGTGMGVEVLVDEGRILTAFQHERLHETMEYGSSYRRSVPVSPELLTATQLLMAALRYTGVAMVEYLYNHATGQWIFVEINGRFWGSLPLAVESGADFPYYLYQYWVENRRSFPQEYRKHVYCRNLLLDLQGRRRRKATGQPRVQELSRDALAIASLRHHIDSFSLDDPKPGMEEMGSILRKGVRWLATPQKNSRNTRPERKA